MPVTQALYAASDPFTPLTPFAGLCSAVSLASGVELLRYTVHRTRDLMVEVIVANGVNPMSMPPFFWLEHYRMLPASEV